MRKAFLVIVLAMLVSSPVLAQQYSGCCYDPNQKISYAAGSATNFGQLDEFGCVKAWPNQSWQAAPCPEPTPGPQPTPVPTPWEPGKAITAPGWLSWLLGMFAPKFVVPFAALMAAVLIPIVQLLRQALAAFGSKLSGKVVYIITAAVAFLATFSACIEDGVIQGGEWMTLIGSLLGFILAPFGYKFLYSSAQKAKLP